VGRLTDVIIRLGAGTYPPVSGLVVQTGGRDVFVRLGDVGELTCNGVQITCDPNKLGEFERRPGEVLLSRDLWSRHVIYVPKVRLVRANEIELADLQGRWQVIGVDTSRKPVLRRWLPRSLRRRVRPGTIVDWADIEPFVSHVPTARLRLPFRKLAKIHPAQLADLVEAASHEEGEEIIRAVGADRELEADVFEELDPEHQVEFLRSRSDEEAARLLAAMAPDDAVDLLGEIQQERRLPILQRIPAPAQLKIRTLLDYNPESAGGLMNPDFIAVREGTSVAETLARVRSSPLPPEAVGVVFVTGTGSTLRGTVLLADLVRADPKHSVNTLMRPEPVVLSADADIHEVVGKMTDFNLAVAPVVDDEGHMLGQITVDDVLELMLPAGWRRQYGMTAAD
jgi:CBS domain-containing protein